jgi:hypothetical protein
VRSGESRVYHAIVVFGWDVKKKNAKGGEVTEVAQRTLRTAGLSRWLGD